MKNYSILAFLALAAGVTMAQQPQKFQTLQLNAGVYAINAEVAAKPDEREQGLMFRQKMAQNEGMVFVFDKTNTICMWMKNTFIPLSVAFIDDNSKIVNIEDMTPQTTDSHCSKQGAPVRYALEMNQGWFKQKNVKPGSIIGGLPHPN